MTTTRAALAAVTRAAAAFERPPPGGVWLAPTDHSTRTMATAPLEQANWAVERATGLPEFWAQVAKHTPTLVGLHRLMGVCTASRVGVKGSLGARYTTGLSARRGVAGDLASAGRRERGRRRGCEQGVHETAVGCCRRRRTEVCSWCAAGELVVKQ